MCLSCNRGEGVWFRSVTKATSTIALKGRSCIFTHMKRGGGSSVFSVAGPGLPKGSDLSKIDWRSTMNIKSLLIGSAAALVAFSGAQAADAIVAAEPEAVEYVKVCDAFGTGYF